MKYIGIFEGENTYTHVIKKDGLYYLADCYNVGCSPYSEGYETIEELYEFFLQQDIK